MDRPAIAKRRWRGEVVKRCNIDDQKLHKTYPDYRHDFHASIGTAQAMNEEHPNQSILDSLAPRTINYIHVLVHLLQGIDKLSEESQKTTIYSIL